MSRGLSSEVQLTIAGKVVRPAILVFLDFVSGPVYMWSGKGTLTWDGHDFIGAGKFGGVSGVTESKKVSANGVELSLSGIPSESITEAQNQANRGRAAKVWRVYFDADGTTIVADPFRTFGGFINAIKILDSGDLSKITVQLETRIIDLNRARERYWTDEQQKADHPGDRFCEFVESLQNKDLPWGQPNPTNATTAASFIGKPAKLQPPFV